MPTIPRSQTPDPRRRKSSEARDRPQDKRYWSPTWRKARLAYLGHHPTCVECERPAKVLDHIVPVRLGGAFWDSSNWQSLCERCHATKSGKEAHQ
jgi:5-methylcytosine-specific restriction enzyme A